MRFVAYSKFDGLPLPARNPQELEVLLQQGHHAEPPEVPSEEPAGADVSDPAGNDDNERVRDEGRVEGVAGDRPGASVSPATGKRN